MKKLFFIISFFSLVLLSCSGPEDKLVGKWTGPSSLSINLFSNTIVDNYSSSRILQTENSKTGLTHTLIFTKKSNGEGTFEDEIKYGINIEINNNNKNNKKIFIGSLYTGKWYIKEKKLYLFYDSCSLVDAKNLNSEEQQYLKSLIEEKFAGYIAMAKNGLDYDLSSDGKFEDLTLYFGEEKVRFSRKK